MGRVLTNNISIEVARESSLGVLPGSPIWFLLEPNEIGAFGADITTVARDPISNNRQRQKGTVVDLDSSVELTLDLTKEHVRNFADCFVFANFVGPVRLQSGADFDNLAADDDAPPAGTDSGYTHDALASALAIGTLVYARGFTTAGNNGLTDVITGSTTTATLVSKTLVDETPTQAQNATLEVAGVRAGTSDLAITVTGETAIITSTVLDFTTLSLTLGQTIHVGGLLVANQFSAGAGYGRVTAIAANQLDLDRIDATLATDPGTGDTVDLLFGQFLRNVSVDAGDYLEQSLQFEAAYPNLAEPGPGDEYEYALGNYCNTLSFNLPLTDKSTMTVGFVGTDTEPPTGTRKTNAATPVNPTQTVSFNTSSDIVRLRMQEADATDLTTCFKSLTLTLNNNASPEKCLGTLGALFMNTGNFEVDIEAQVLFTDKDVPEAIRNNETVNLDFIVKNDDGAVSVDIPSMTIGGGDKEFPRNESVLLNTTGMAFEDATLGTSIGISLFPVVP